MIRGNITILASSLFTILCSVAYFLYNQQLIIIKSPFGKTYEKHAIEQVIAQKKKIKHFFWHHDAWRQEIAEILWSDQKVQALCALITSWLTIVEEEKINTKKISLQSIALSTTQQEVFCSFDRNPFNKQQSTYEKLMWIEGLLKTIRESGIKVQHIRFLVHHQPMHDAHLDFSNAWPVSGFLKDEHNYS